MTRKASSEIHVVCPEAVRCILEQSIPKTVTLQNRTFDVKCIGLQENSDARSAQFVFDPADFHIIFLHAAPWMTEALVRGVVRSFPIQPFPVQRMLLAGFLDPPEESFSELTRIDRQRSLGLLFEAFRVHYLQLPIDPKVLAGALVTCCGGAEADVDDEWSRNVGRVLSAIQRMRKNGETDFDAWARLDALSGPSRRRMQEEHEIGNRQSIEALGRFQSAVDCYYLAAARTDGLVRRRFVVIEDHPDLLEETLKFLAAATGDEFHITKNQRCCSDLVAWIRQRNDEQEPDTDAFPSEFFERIGSGEANEHPQQPDAVLVDLLLGKNDEGIDIGGEEVIRYLQDRRPELPVFVITRSEEPDVLGRCIAVHGADRVIPKRRLVRLPYTLLRFLHDEVSPLLPFLDCPPEAGLSRRVVAAYRTWTTYPGILWHGEKTFHAADHTLEHHNGLWKLANQLVFNSWAHIQKYRTTKMGASGAYSSDDLFRFLMSIWLHDIGCKGSDRFQMADQVRSRHSWISGELIRRNPQIYRLRRGTEADIVELLCAYHQSCAPFETMDECKDAVKGLFHQSLAEITRDSNWRLMEWGALLRLIDSADHHWRRVGIRQLYKAKQIAIQTDLSFYRSQNERPDAAEYASWLAEQEGHMRKHLAVLDASFRVRPFLEADCFAVFWPEYTFTTQQKASEYLPEIGLYVLKEWWATGKHIEEEMGLRLIEEAPIAGRRGRCFAVWNDKALQDLNGARTAADGARGKQIEIEEEMKRVAKKLWLSSE